ncbi:unnamed protein product, partial [Brenthis ino]
MRHRKPVHKCTSRLKCTLYSCHSHTPMGRLFDTTSESEGAGPMALRALRGTEVKHRQFPNSAAANEASYTERLNN